MNIILTRMTNHNVYYDLANESNQKNLEKDTSLLDKLGIKYTIDYDWDDYSDESNNYRKLILDLPNLEKLIELVDNMHRDFKLGFFYSERYIEVYDDYYKAVQL